MRVAKQLLAQVSERKLFAPQESCYQATDRIEVGVYVPFGMNRDGELSAQSRLIAQVAGRFCCEGFIRTMVFCGGHKAQETSLTEAEAAKQLVLNCCPITTVYAETKSRDTRENALYAKPILDDLACDKAVLFVNAFQSHRALRVFQKVMPAIDFKVIAVCANEWRDNSKRTLRNRYIFALRELGAWGLYRLHGWL